MNLLGGRRLDRALALGLGAAYVIWLLATTRTLGYARDEGFYFHAARAYRGWFELLLSEPLLALSRQQVDRFWIVNHEHPALMKVAFLLSHELFHEKLGWFAEAGTAYRFPGMLASGLGVAVVYAWGSRALGRGAGLVAALLFALMPRVFYHAHLACFDMPVAALWLSTAYVYARSLETHRLAFVLAAGVAYGLLLNTKHNAWLMPFALVPHLLILRGRELGRGLGRARRLVPPALLAMLVLGPLVFYLGWPWLWFDTFARFAEYVRFHTGHEYYNMEFLGVTYWKPPMPRAYAWVMTLATVPGITLLLFAIGLAAIALDARAAHARGQWSGDAERPLTGPFPTGLMWILAVAVSYAPWWSPDTPIFGGTKHWLTAYPFLCLIAGRGFGLLALKTREALAEVRVPSRAVEPVLAACVLAAPLAMTLHSHPWGLSFYTPLVGGAPGAASLGLNRTFWGYTTGAVERFLNERAKTGAAIYLHDTAVPSWDMLREDARVRRDLRGTLAIHHSNLALYHHEPHMGRVEYQIWSDYGTLVPSYIVGYDGVPVVWVYERQAR